MNNVLETQYRVVHMDGRFDRTSSTYTDYDIVKGIAEKRGGTIEVRGYMLVTTDWHESGK